MIFLRGLVLFSSFFLLPHSIYGQIVDEKKEMVQPSKFLWVSDTSSTKLERLAYVAGCSVAFSLLDFIGFNATQFDKTARTGYRILQVTSQVALSYFLYQKFGLSSAVSFNLIWWT